MIKFHHIFFDNDGTLVDSEIIAVRTMLRHLKTYGFDMEEKEYSIRYPGHLEKDILAMIEISHGVKVPVDFLQKLHDEHVELFDNHLVPIDGMDHLFRQLKTPKSMVSNASVVHVERCLRRIGLLDEFQGHIFSANQVERPKPFPDVYHFALNTTQVHPGRVLVVEDSPTGVEAAKAAGLTVVGFLGASHIGDGHDKVLEQKGADYIIPNAKELKKLFITLGVQ